MTLEELRKSIDAIQNLYDKKYGKGAYAKIKVSAEARESEAEPERLPFKDAPKKKLGSEAHERYTTAKRRLAKDVGLPETGWGLYAETILARHKKKNNNKTEKAMKLVFDLRKARDKADLKKGGPYNRGGSHQFDAATRAHVAREMADDFHDEVQDGDHDHHLNKKHKKMHPKGIARVAKQHEKR
jgi:hypothetical protein